MFDTPFIIPVAFAFAWVAVTWIRARHGLPTRGYRSRWDPDNSNVSVPPMFDKLVNKAMAERDAEIDELRQRIEVLEKIVIDTHKRHNLSEEIDRLRDEK
ncbi:MAG TPA: hypothetical protein VNR18_12710 [Hyphomicrobiales bacterium]|nr:hypothetical protein [Hyphomicrobiales bacterium]